MAPPRRASNVLHVPCFFGFSRCFLTTLGTPSLRTSWKHLLPTAMPHPFSMPQSAVISELSAAGCLSIWLLKSVTEIGPALRQERQSMTPLTWFRVPQDWNLDFGSLDSEVWSLDPSSKRKHIFQILQNNPPLSAEWIPKSSHCAFRDLAPYSSHTQSQQKRQEVFSASGCLVPWPNF